MELILNSYSRFLVLFISGFCWYSAECAFSISPHENSNPVKRYSDSPEKSHDIRPSRNFWELISSSSDVVPLQNRSIADVTLPAQISVETRLQKLEFHFNTLKIYDEDCRQRLLCNLAESPSKFAPLSTALLDETSYNGDEKTLATGLLATNEGARLLTYIEAAQKGYSRSGCDIWTYRCPQTATSMIDYKSLLVWRELSKWLTVKFVARRS